MNSNYIHKVQQTMCWSLIYDMTRIGRDGVLSQIRSGLRNGGNQEERRQMDSPLLESYSCKIMPRFVRSNYGEEEEGLDEVFFAGGTDYGMLDLRFWFPENLGPLRIVDWFKPGIMFPSFQRASAGYTMITISIMAFSWSSTLIYHTSSVARRGAGLVQA